MDRFHGCDGRAAPKFDYAQYLLDHPYNPSTRPQRLIWVAYPFVWVVSGSDWKSSIGLSELDWLWEDWRVLSNVHFYDPDPAERVDQPLKGMVAVSCAIMGVGLRFSLHPNISHLVNFWEVAPIQIHLNGWLQVICLMTVLRCLRLYHLPTLGEVTHLVSLNNAPRGVGRSMLYVKSQKMAFIKGITSKLGPDGFGFRGIGGRPTTLPRGRLLFPPHFMTKKGRVLFVILIIRTDLILSLFCRLSVSKGRGAEFRLQSCP